MIAELLGEPDEKREFRRGTYRWTAHLYRAGRVAAAEATEAFTTARDAAAARRESCRAVRAAGVERRLAEIAAWTPAVPRHPFDTLHQLAVDHFNQRLDAHVMRRAERFDDYDDGYEEAPRRATLDSDPAFLARIAVNYLRHQPAARYDAKLEPLGHRRDREREAVAIKRRVFGRIAEVYPELAAEVQRQLEQRVGGTVE